LIFSWCGKISGIGRLRIKAPSLQCFMQSVMDDGDVAMAAHFSDKTAVPAPTHYLKITAVLDTNQYGRSPLNTQQRPFTHQLAS
jgi:hypothetical protein